jgi:uncharacterized protein YdaU (DUF1376 family)
MSKPDVWMPLYIGEYLADTMRLTTVQHGAYLLLLMQYWKSGPLPDDDEELAGIAKMEVRAWSKISASIRRFFHVGEDGLLHQRRADAEREKASDISSKRRAAAMQRTDRKPADDKQTEGGRDEPEKQEQVQLQEQVDVQLQDQMQQHLPHLLDTHARGLLPSPSKKEPGPSGPDAEAASPPDAATLLWREGIPILQALTGKSDGQCRGLLGKLRQGVDDDCPKLLMILQQARDMRPSDPVAWLTAATQGRDRRPQRRETHSEERRRKLGIKSRFDELDIPVTLDAETTHVRLN